ncbi:tetratricopeptide repeat protein [Muriicola sp.]|uniref:tetratricopeptide repeat protein n=1 Tax=Muriicola sp. TaxID=2020856 RepID=UPI00356A309A
MRMKKTAITLVALGLLLTVRAQESGIYTDEDRMFREALELYNNRQYQAAQTLFEKVGASTENETTAANSAYYAANAAVRLNQVGADRLMEEFVENYPTSTKRDAAYLDVADYYFENGKYPYALKWYEKVEPGLVPFKDRDRFHFNLGYSLYSAKKPAEAKTYFNRVLNSEKYGPQAKYYLGFIAYQQDDYEGATRQFDQITDQELLDEKLSYFQADLNFKLGNFEEAIALAKKQLPVSDRQEVSELHKIIGESYFNLKQYAEAIPHLESYRGKRGKWNNTDFYQLGYCYYQQGDYANAILQFNKIIGGKDPVAQNAYYHLAECYLKLDKKQEALNAFRNASQMDFSAEIRKDALLNYARLSYEIGNAYEPVTDVLLAYLEQYPRDEYSNEIQDLLVDSYLTSRNFKGALELLDVNRNYANKSTYQKVAFFRGMELFTEGDYTEAVDVLERAVRTDADAIFTARARYWKAEAEYLLNRFDQALVDFIQFQQSRVAANTPEYKELDYNLAYTYFKLKDYNSAIPYFRNFENRNAGDPKGQDAVVRLGDCYFVNREYDPAIRAYSRYISANGQEQDYAAFQKSISYGFMGRNDTKISELNDFRSRYPSSTLNDDVLFELGNTYVRENREQEGLRAYAELVDTYGGSKLVPEAMLRQGLVHYNANRNEEALKQFRAVVSKFPGSEEASQAVNTAKLVYMDMGRVNEYAAWVKNLDFVEVSDSELDNATYESAEQQNLENRTEAAIRGFENYIRDFPSGRHIVDARFKLAQLYFSQGKGDKALSHYRYVADRGGSEYKEQALARTCELLLAQGDNSMAMKYLGQLETSADIPQNRTYARQNLMRLYYGQQDYQKTLLYADKVLAADGIDDRIRSDAQVMIARSAIKTGDEAKAEEAYGRVLKIATGILAAEALYHDAYFKQKRGALEASNTAVQKLAREYSIYKEWGGKGLIVMAQNFYALGDAFQATYILESVIDNFSQFPEIQSSARKELSSIKAREAEKNASVNPDEN